METPSTPGLPDTTSPAAFVPGSVALEAMKSGALPTRYDGPPAWTGAEMRERDDWIVWLSEADRGELDAAWRATLHLPIESIGPREFALPILGSKLLALRDKVIGGRGFVLLRGLDIEGWPIERTARVYWGLGSWLGRAVSQNAIGHLLGHVRDLEYDIRDPNVRTYQTTERQLHHTDSCDIVGLLCLRPAKQGGLSSIVSSVTLYNEMARRRPGAPASRPRCPSRSHSTAGVRFPKTRSRSSSAQCSATTTDWFRATPPGVTSNRRSATAMLHV